jgi:hypothetical protein
MSIADTLISAGPAITAICTVSVILVKVMTVLIKNVMAKFESEMTSKVQSLSISTELSNKFVKDEIDEQKFDHLESGNEKFRTEINDRLTRYETVQLEQKDEIHHVEKELLSYKLEVAKEINRLAEQTSNK